MKDNEILEKQDLCEKLSMSFEEANELFGTETLQSMQMAQVNGGFGWPALIKRVIEGVALAADLGSIVSLVKDYTKDSTPPPGFTITHKNGEFEITGGSDTVITVTGDSIISKANGDTYYYNIKIQSTPTPAP